MNGSRSRVHNLTVDGVSNMDTGNSGILGNINRNGLGHARARAAPSSRVASLWIVSRTRHRRTPELAAAVRRSLEIRGDQATGWATAWRINLLARLGDGAHAYDILKFLLSPERTYPNMFDAHPPFQIDGNFGGISAIAEILIQCDGSEIRLLPALPPAWPTGRVTGLRARGGFEIDLSWRNGSLERAIVRSLLGQAPRLRRGDTLRSPGRIARGAVLTFVGDYLQPSSQ